MVTEPKDPKQFRVAFFLDDFEVLTVVAPVSKELAKQLQHVKPSESMFEKVFFILHGEAGKLPQNASRVCWFGKIEKREPE